MEQSYTIHIDQFQGPFDLLLFFIERDELDIHDIPIAKITQDFLDYIRQLERLNIDVASEFILVAATLMRIKARMLLPRIQIDEEGNEIDPRKELIQMLLEYRKLKSILHEMEDMEENRSKSQFRGNIKNELSQIASKALVDLELESLSMYNLLKAFNNVMLRYENIKNRTKHHIFLHKYKIQDQQDYILDKISSGKKVDFYHVFNNLENRMHCIVTFLGLLELLNSHVLKILQGEGNNNFWLEKN